MHEKQYLHKTSQYNNKEEEPSLNHQNPLNYHKAPQQPKLVDPT